MSHGRLRGIQSVHYSAYLEDPSIMILSIVDRGADIAYCSLAALRRADATSHSSCGRGGFKTHSTTTPQGTTALPHSGRGLMH